MFWLGKPILTVSFIPDFVILRKTKRAKKYVFLTVGGLHTLLENYTKILANPLYILANGGQGC